MKSLIALVAAVSLAGTVSAQRAPIFPDRNGNPQGAQPIICVAADNTPCPKGTASDPLAVEVKRETFQLVSANNPSAAVTLFGGSYVLNQNCSTYGTLTLRYLSADGVTMLALSTKTAPDSGGGTMLQFGMGQVVDVALSSTTGCYATLSRVP